MKFLRYRKVMSEDNVKRNNWPMGMVTEVHEGANGFIRTVTLKTQKGTLNRSIQKLHLLEGHKEHINDERLREKTCIPGTVTKPKSTKSFDVVHQGGENVDKPKTRPMRLRRPPVRYVP